MSTISPQRPATIEETPSTNGASEPETRVPQEEAQGPFAIRQLISDYVIPVETNNFWYALGGVLAISLFLEVLTGFILTLKYVPDAEKAFGITKDMIQSSPWSIILNFHFYNSFLIFGLVMIHMMRVFISGGYKRGKGGLWTVGVGLAAFTFIISLTGEALHWDEVGFGVPWNTSEVLSAFGLADAFNYTTDALLNVATATEKLVQLYVVHIALVPILLLLFVGMHYYLVKVKGISVPFWLKASGRKAPFSEHIKVWLIYSGIILGVVLLISIFVQRDPGTAPQLLQSSPLYNTADDPGGLGFKPTFPISWTRGMNVAVANFGVDPDIWGTILGMVIMFGALLLIPLLDRGVRTEPQGWAATFDLRKRGWAFLAVAIFWVIMLVGLMQSAFTSAG